MIAADVCWCILHMYYDLDMTPEQIAPLVWTPKHDISVRSVQRVINRFETNGTVRGPRRASSLD